MFDFHAHGGDVRRTGEIADYIRLEGLSGLCLLSLPLAGYPGYRDAEGPPHMNEAVLESKKKLKGIPVYAFGCLDNRDLPAGGRRALARRTAGSQSPDTVPEDFSPAAQVAALAEAGFDGLKLWEGKPALAAALGLLPDSPRIIEACREAGRRGMPVIFHVADPRDLWHPGAGADSLAGGGVPGFDELIEGAARLCEQAPEAAVVFPHLLFLADDLIGAADFLDRAPNAFFDLAPGNYAYAPLAENPGVSRDFFVQYASRILFGSDAFFFSSGAGAVPFSGDSLEGNRRRCSRLLEFLQTELIIDNPYPRAPESRREVRGLKLPAHVLQLILGENARRIMPRVPKEVRG